MGARRLHALSCPRRPAYDCGNVASPYAIRLEARLCADFDDGGGLSDPALEPKIAGGQSEGIHRARQTKSRQIQFRIDRHRQRAASRRPTVLFGGRPQAHAYPLSRLLTAELPGYRGRIVWDPSQPDGQPRRALDTSKAERLLGWKAKTRFEDGLRRTIGWRSEEHTSELQSHSFISYAGFCLKKKKTKDRVPSPRPGYPPPPPRTSHAHP